MFTRVFLKSILELDIGFCFSFLYLITLLKLPHSIMFVMIGYKKILNIRKLFLLINKNYQHFYNKRFVICDKHFEFQNIIFLHPFLKLCTCYTKSISKKDGHVKKISFILSSLRHYHATSVLVQVPTTPIPIQHLANGLGKVADYLKFLSPVTYVGDPKEVLGSWFRPDPTLAIMNN